MSNTIELDNIKRNEIISKYETMTSIVRKNLMFINPVFSSLLYQMYWRLDFNPSENAFAYIIYEKNNDDAVAMNSIFLSYKLFENNNFTYKNYIFILLHELLHKLSGHNSRKGNRDDLLWNLATDHVINSFLKKCENEYTVKEIRPAKINQDNKIVDGWDTVFIDKTIKKDMTAEEVYEYLLQQNDRFDFKAEKTPDGVNIITVHDKLTNQKHIVYYKDGDQSDVNSEKELRSEARERLQKLNSKGNKSNFISEFISKILKVELPWHVILKNAIQKYTMPIPGRRSWVRVNSKYRGINLILPGKLNSYDESGVSSLIVSVDTSGSISKEDLKKFSGIIYDSFSFFKNIILITHDVNIHQYEIFDNENQNEFMNFILNTGFLGRGGTSHKLVFDKIEELIKDQYENISLYMALTDGISDIETEWKLHEWSSKNKLPTYFILTGNYTLKGFEYTYDVINQTNPRQIRIKD